MSQRVIITGASSGIGAALVHEYARRGFDIGLCARRSDVLEQLSNEIMQQYPGQKCLWETLDVAQLDDVAPVLNRLNERLGSVDIVIVNAGITGVRRTGSGDLSTDLQVLQVNLLGAIATLDAAVAIFRTQGHGHLVGISSFSAFRGIPGSAAYSASKAALTNYLQAVRTELFRKNIQVTCIHPGFIKTDISPGMEKFPFVIDADKAARIMADAIRRKQREKTVPGWPWVLLKYLMPRLPDSVIAKVF